MITCPAHASRVDYRVMGFSVYLAYTVKSWHSFTDIDYIRMLCSSNNIGLLVSCLSIIIVNFPYRKKFIWYFIDRLTSCMSLGGQVFNLAVY